MSAIRVRLSFENYSSLFGTPSPSCWFLIDTESNTTISDLENSIKSRFNINQQLDIGLTLDKFLLPSHEKILILRDNDSVRVKIHAVVCEPPFDASSGAVQSNTSGTPDNRERLCQQTQVVVSPHSISSRETRCYGSVEKQKKKKKNKKELNVRDIKEGSNVDEPLIKKGSSKSKVDTKKLKANKETRKRKRCSSEENPGKKVKKCQNASPKLAISESVPKVHSKFKKELVISSSESSSEEEVVPITKSKSVNITRGTTKTVSKVVTTPKTLSKTTETSSSSCSSSVEEEVERQGLGFKGKFKGKNSVASDDSEAERKAAANAEAERQLEELLSRVDAKTKARRRRRKRDNQKRRRRSKIDNPDHVNAVNEIHASESLREPGRAHVPNSSLPDNGSLHVSENYYNGAEMVANGEVGATCKAATLDVVNGLEDHNIVGSSPRNEPGLNGKNGKDCKRDNNVKKNRYHEKTKEEQLNSSYTNCSYVYEYPAHEDMQEEEPELKLESEPKDYSGFPLSEGLPKQGDKIAYKVLELSETYTPEVSSYKECEILVADAVTRTLVVKLILQPKVKNVGKFDIIDEDYDTTGPSSDEMMSLAWSSLIEPRLIS
ncbi:coilin-like [Lineus longissimus]|uniref:coilin-like n=1 Tax=Lineus longissimus TaxID=88925 RepID=UPI002B4EBF00